MTEEKSRFPSWRHIWVIILLLLIPLMQWFLLQSWNEPPQKEMAVARIPVPLPDWRIATDCSTYDLSCVPFKATQQGLYQEYPFRFADKYDGNYQWESFTMPNEKTNVTQLSTNVFPVEAPIAEYNACVEKRLQVDSYAQQLADVLKQVKRQPDLNMVAVTLTDIKYATDMIHEVFQMNDEIVGFRDAFFMVALDADTVKLGCRYGYPVIAGPSVAAGHGERVDLRSNLQSTKFALSFDLVKHKVPFFFYEMDVWFIRPPIAALKDFSGDVLVSAHTDNPGGPNIGVYAVWPTEASHEFFELCCSLLEQAPESHDQFVFWEIWFLARDPNKKFDNENGWKPVIPPKPTLQHPFQGFTFESGSFAANVHPYITEKTLAVHTLCNGPLRTPHGKKMVAKERGAWFGFHSPADQGGYYARKGERRRYLMLDGRELGGYSWNMRVEDKRGYYHDLEILQWTVATLVTLAQKTDRILILPKIAHDFYVTFIWPLLDLESLEGLVEFRETSFVANPKAWLSAEVPFATVARTALGISYQRENYKWKLFAQHGNQVSAWKMSEKDPVTSWFRINTGVPEIDKAELLLVNPQFVQRVVVGDRLCSNHHDQDDPVVQQIRHVFQKKLKWCSFPSIKPAVQIHAEDDCYTQGQPTESCNL